MPKGALSACFRPFRLTGRDTVYRYRRGRGVPVGEGRVSFRDVMTSDKIVVSISQGLIRRPVRLNI